jgi:hypothetical protein
MGPKTAPKSTKKVVTSTVKKGADKLPAVNGKERKIENKKSNSQVNQNKVGKLPEVVKSPRSDEISEQQQESSNTKSAETPVPSGNALSNVADAITAEETKSIENELLLMAAEELLMQTFMAEEKLRLEEELRVLSNGMVKLLYEQYGKLVMYTFFLLNFIVCLFS